MKKAMIGVVLAIAMALSAVPATANGAEFIERGASVQAGASAESETISPGEWLTGSLDSANDTKYYAFTIDKPGWALLEYATVSSKNTGGWSIGIVDGNGNDRLTYRGDVTTYLFSDEWKVVSDQIETNRLSAGTYYVKVSPMIEYTESGERTIKYTS